VKPANWHLFVALFARFEPRRDHRALEPGLPVGRILAIVDDFTQELTAR
jgi:hypothetical protein